MNTNTSIRMTEYSHGAGCGCKISPKLLDTLLKSNIQSFDDKSLLVGNASKDDAAVYDIGHGQAVISTTDFFMPIVDDPFVFGQIAATNAISDIYAMGGKPIMAIAIFGWPLDKLPLEVGQQVIDGGREVCHRAGMPLAGGHSIDAPEPIFGLAVTGMVAIDQLKRNDTAQADDLIFLTKPLGVGILTTAQKQKKLQDTHKDIAINNMLLLNQAGVDFAKMDGVHAMTDVTGFGLGGHLSEVCVGSKLHAEINFDAIPLLPHVLEYLEQGCAPGGAQRNFDSYGHHLNSLSSIQQSILCDPQTSGGLLVCVAPEAEAAFLRGAQEHNLHLTPIGRMVSSEETTATITVR